MSRKTAYWFYGFLSLMLLPACGEQIQATDEVPVVQVSDKDLEIAPHSLPEFFEENWSQNNWEMFSVRDEDFDPHNPVEIYDPEFLSSLPRSVGTFGDSMTRAAVAAYKRHHIALPWVWFNLLGGGLKAALSKKLDGLEMPGLSWSTGLGVELQVPSHHRSRRPAKTVVVSKVLSLAKRIELLRNDSLLEVANMAESGAESDDVSEKQLLQLNRHSRSRWGQEFPDLVTLLIGGNDACARNIDGMTSVNEYHDRMSYVIDTVLRRSPKTKIMVTGVPNIDELRNTARNAKLVGLGGVQMTCHDLWKLVGQCKTLTLTDDPKKREVIRQRVVDYNSVLRSLVDQRNHIYGDRVRYASTYELEYTPDDLSLDCFHPNISGQNKLASEVWEETWWAQQ